MPNSINLPKPSIEQVYYYLQLRDSLEHYVLQEKALNKLFKVLLPANQDMNDVLLKCSTLNDFYSTNIFSIYSVAKKILTIPNLDERLAKGDTELVNEIRKVTISGKTKDFYSFATKYCCHHNPDDFPIYDSYVDKMLVALNRTYRFAEFKRKDLKDYSKLKVVLLDFRHYFGLTQFSLREIDTYLWLWGKVIFQVKK